MIIFEIIKNQLIRIPWIKRIQKKDHCTGPVSEETNEMIFNLYGKFINFTGKVVLEIGPGKNSAIAKKICTQNPEIIYLLDIENYISPENLDNEKVIKYIIYDGAHFPMEQNSIDVIISHTVYEHVREPNKVIHETYRVLKPGGVIIHLIDLGDHLSYGNHERKLFNCLRYRNWMWHLMSCNRSIYVNRLRVSDWVNLHTVSGFKIFCLETKESELIKELYLKGQLGFLDKFENSDRFVYSLLLCAQKL